MARVRVLQVMIGNGVAFSVGDEAEWPDADVENAVAAGLVALLERRAAHAAEIAAIPETVVETEVAGRKARTASTKPRQHR